MTLVKNIGKAACQHQARDRLPLLIVVPAFLFGCASQSVKEAQRIQTIARDASAQHIICEGAIAAKPQYAHLLSKFPIGYDDKGKERTPTAAQLADPETVSDDDIAAALDWYGETQICDRKGLDMLGKIDPELLIIGARAEQEDASLLRDMVQNHLTYGAVNTRGMEIRSHTRAAINQWAQGLRARLDAMRRQEEFEHQQFMAQVGAVSQALANVALATVTVLAQQQALAAQAQLNYARTHPTYVPAFRITTTNCQWIGRIWSCTSY